MSYPPSYPPPGQPHDPGQPYDPQQYPTQQYQPQPQYQPPAEQYQAPVGQYQAAAEYGDDPMLPKAAHGVAVVFNVLSYVVLIVGILGAVVFVVVGIAGAGGRNGGQVLLTGIGGAVGTLAYTAIAWASVKLANVVARYIALKSR